MEGPFANAAELTALLEAKQRQFPAPGESVVSNKPDASGDSDAFKPAHLETAISNALQAAVRERVLSRAAQLPFMLRLAHAKTYTL